MCSANIDREIENDERKAVDNRLQGTHFGRFLFAPRQSAVGRLQKLSSSKIIPKKRLLPGR
jgi:hypothetical protein